MPRANSQVFHPRLHEKVTGWRDRGLPAEGTITKPGTGTGTLNEATGVLEPPAPVTVYDGPCMVQPDTQGRETHVVGDTPVTLRRYVVSLSASVAGADLVDVGQVLTITASKDTGLVGRPMVVTDVAYDDAQTRRLLRVEDRPGVNP